jgi:hypothetical protein
MNVRIAEALDPSKASGTEVVCKYKQVVSFWNWGSDYSGFIH